MKPFHRLLINTMAAGLTTNFLWFSVTYWAYLETRSVLATSIIGGSFMLLSALSGFLFGTFVDRHKKKGAMLFSNVVSLAAFVAATLLFLFSPPGSILVLTSLRFWAFVLIILSGSVIGNVRGIALSTCVTLLVPDGERDRANGLVGTVNGISFAVTTVFSGLVVGRLGMTWALGISVVLTVVTCLDLLSIAIPEPDVAGTPTRDGERPAPAIDVKGAVAAIAAVPGLFGLIFFSTFNNFLGGVFMSLIDPYGLELVSVEVWGIIWGFLSVGFILGGIVVARRGLGTSPLRTLFLANITMWTVTILFPLYSSVVPLIVGFFIYLCLMPAVEAAEQTIVQRVVPFEVQGRVFGFAQAVETAASPVTAFLIGPVADLWVIPFMTTGGGVASIGAWFGTGAVRAMALVFIVAGVIGLAVTLAAMGSRAYRQLSGHYSGNSGLADEAVAG